MSVAFKFQDELSSVHCCLCGVHFALPSTMEAKRRDDHQTFFCPNGHGQAYSGKTEADKLRDELAREKQRREMAEREAGQESRRATKAEKRLKRTEHRVSNGVCTCCNRTFQNLARHMATKHPDKK